MAQTAKGTALALERFARTVPFTGEQGLHLALLSDAALSLWPRRPGTRKSVAPAVRTAARTWFESKSNTPFSFEETARVLKLNPAAIRRRLLS